MSSSSGVSKRCSKCGSENSKNARSCWICHKPLMLPGGVSPMDKAPNTQFIKYSKQVAGAKNKPGENAGTLRLLLFFVTVGIFFVSPSLAFALGLIGICALAGGDSGSSVGPSSFVGRFVMLLFIGGVLVFGVIFVWFLVCLSTKRGLWP